MILPSRQVPTLHVFFTSIEAEANIDEKNEALGTASCLLARYRRQEQEKEQMHLLWKLEEL